MSNIDRRIVKSREAIKKAILELMSEKEFNDITIQDIADRANVSRRTVYLHYVDKFDLLDKLIQEHVDALRELRKSSSDMDFIDGNRVWFQYLESHYQFFSTMLGSNGASSFRKQFLDFVIGELKDEVDVEEGRNREIDENVLLRFVAAAYVEVLEWWFTNEMPYPPDAMAEQVGDLVERIL